MEIIAADADPIKLCARLYREVNDGTYRSGKYHRRVIFEPKKRTIYALPISDRILHQLLVEKFLKPWYMQLFIPTTFACIPDRGSLQAADCVRRFQHKAIRKYGKNYYILQLDFSKYFESIDRDILFGMVEKDFRCKKLKNLLHTIIFEVGDPNIKGLPIGNYTSQFLANRYVNDLDHMVHDGNGAIRRKFPGIVGYVRYMDDVIIVVDTKETAANLLAEIKLYTHSALKLRLNTKSRYYPGRLGVNFCGYITHPDMRFMRKHSKDSMKRLVQNYKRGLLDNDEFMRRLASYKGHAAHADSYNFLQKHFGPYKAIFDVSRSKQQVKREARARAVARKKEINAEGVPGVLRRAFPELDLQTPNTIAALKAKAKIYRDFLATGERLGALAPICDCVNCAKLSEITRENRRFVVVSKKDAKNLAKAGFKNVQYRKVNMRQHLAFGVHRPCEIAIMDNPKGKLEYKNRAGASEYLLSYYSKRLQIVNRKIEKLLNS